MKKVILVLLVAFAVVGCEVPQTETVSYSRIYSLDRSLTNSEISGQYVGSYKTSLYPIWHPAYCRNYSHKDDIVGIKMELKNNGTYVAFIYVTDALNEGELKKYIEGDYEIIFNTKHHKNEFGEIISTSHTHGLKLIEKNTIYVDPKDKNEKFGIAGHSVKSTYYIDGSTHNTRFRSEYSDFYTNEYTEFNPSTFSVDEYKSLKEKQRKQLQKENEEKERAQAVKCNKLSNKLHQMLSKTEEWEEGSCSYTLTRPISDFVDMDMEFKGGYEFWYPIDLIMENISNYEECLELLNEGIRSNCDLLACMSTDMTDEYGDVDGLKDHLYNKINSQKQFVTERVKAVEEKQGIEVYSPY